MSYLDRTKHIPKFGGNIWYINKNTGSDDNNGKTPLSAFETIGAGITAMSDGDALNIKAGTYTETGLDLSNTGAEMWFEIGAILDPASGTALTISGNYCRVTCPEGALLVKPNTNETGVLVSGNFCYLNEVRVSCFITDEATSADIGFDITGNGCDLRRCRSSNPDVAAFKIQGDKIKLEDCCTGGGSSGASYSSIGYWITNSCDSARIRYCSSQGHGTAGFQIDSGCTNSVVFDCSSGGGDGAFSNLGTNCIFSDFEYDGAIATFNTPVVKYTTFAGAATTYNIFKITGSVRIQDIIGHVTTVIPNTASAIHLTLYSTGGEVDLTNNVGAPDLDSAPVGSIIVRTDDSSEALELASSATPSIIEYGSRAASVEVNIVADADQDTYIRLNLSNALASGAIHWHCNYKPISDGGFVEPA